MLFQNNALFDYLTVSDNIAFPLRRLEALAEAEMPERVEERLARVALGGVRVALPAGCRAARRSGSASRGPPSRPRPSSSTTSRPPGSTR